MACRAPRALTHERRRSSIAFPLQGDAHERLSHPRSPSWAELTTTDPQAEAAFYGDLFGWKIQSMDMEGGEYRVIKVAGAALAGIMNMPPGAPTMPLAWGV